MLTYLFRSIYAFIFLLLRLLVDYFFYFKFLRAVCIFTSFVTKRNAIVLPSWYFGYLKMVR